MRVWIPILMVSSLAAGGCVKKSTLEAAVGDMSRMGVEGASSRAELALMAQRREACLAVSADRQATIERLTSDAAALSAEVALCRQALEENQRNLASTQTLLRQRGAERDQLVRRLEELAAIEREAARRNEIYEEVLGKFRQLIDAGQLSVVISRGRLVLQLPQDILFASGKADLEPAGIEALTQVGQVLGGFADRQFQVEGHTDNVPIRTTQFPSNWELSTARALAVVHLLQGAGVAATNLSAAGFGEFQPRASNDTPDDRRLNRRIEIVMVPNLDILQNSGEAR
jgi:chemotaxis protein MotB